MQNNFSIKNEQGLTLIDTAIILLVAGLLIVPFLEERRRDIVTSAYENTEENIDLVKDAIDDYYFRTGNRHYPCPADPTIDENDPDPNVRDRFGIEDRKSSYSPPLAMVGVPAKDVCNEALLDSTGTVYIGAVPFADLDLKEHQAFDGYGNKLTYMISVNLTDPDTFATDAGAITVHTPFIVEPHATIPGRTICSATDTNGTPLDEAAENVQNVFMAVLSHGRDGSGAYRSNGQLVRACPSGSDEQVDSQNCNDDNIVITQTCIRSLVDGANYFDDQIAEDITSVTYSSIEERLWNDSVTSTNMRSDYGFMGIHTNSPDHELDVAGNAIVEAHATDPTKSGQVYSSRYCYRYGSGISDFRCFNPEMLAGDDPGMECFNGTAYKGIAYGGKRCADRFSTFDKNETCGPGQYMAGFNNGDIICLNL